MVDHSLQLQQHQQAARLSRVTHVVQVAISAKIRIARIRKVLVMYSLIHYVSLTLMF